MTPCLLNNASPGEKNKSTIRLYHSCRRRPNDQRHRYGNGRMPHTLVRLFAYYCGCRFFLPNRRSIRFNTTRARVNCFSRNSWNAAPAAACASPAAVASAICSSDSHAGLVDISPRPPRELRWFAYVSRLTASSRARASSPVPGKTRDELPPPTNTRKGPAVEFHDS